jgi:hypothetical protein
MIMQTQNVQEVTLDPLAGGPGHNWKVSHKGQTGSDPAHYPHISLGPDTGPWLIHFKINNPGNNIKLADDPIWVQPNSKPTGPVSDPQIIAAVPSSDGKELFVLDKNSNKDPQTLYYSLQFTGHGNVDPIIDNGGHPYVGPRPGSTITLAYPNLALVLLGAFVIGLALGWLIRRR